MSKKQVNHIIRAWKDPVYRSSLSAKERAQLPKNPVGMIEIENSNLRELIGGRVGSNFNCNTNTLYC